MTTDTADLDEAVGQASILLLLAVMTALLFGHLIVKHLALLAKIGAVVAGILVALYVGGQWLE